MFITAVCVIFLIKLRWPKNKSLYLSRIKSLLSGTFYDCVAKLCSDSLPYVFPKSIHGAFTTFLNDMSVSSKC